MSECMRCDRCGRVCDRPPDGRWAAAVYGRDPDDGAMRKMADLCDVCARELAKWLGGR